MLPGITGDKLDLYFTGVLIRSIRSIKWR